MYESTITLPTFDERRWQLRGPRYAVVSIAAIALGFAVYMLWGATVNDQPFEHDGTVYLDVAGTSAIIAVVGCLMLLVAVYCTIAALRMVTELRWIMLGETFVEAPSTAMSKQIVRIPYADLRLTVTEAGSTAIEMRGPGKELIRLGTLNFASEGELQECLRELRRRLAEIEETRVW